MEGWVGDGWEAELERWLEPFLARLRRQAQRHWAPFYLKGLILPGERKSIEPMAARVALATSSSCTTSSRPRPGRRRLWRRSW